MFSYIDYDFRIATLCMQCKYRRLSFQLDGGGMKGVVPLPDPHAYSAGIRPD